MSEDHIEDLEKIETELDEQFGAFGCDDQEDGEADFYCIVCEKRFKTS